MMKVKKVLNIHLYNSGGTATIGRKAPLDKLKDNPYFDTIHLPENLRTDDIWAVPYHLISFKTDRINTEKNNWKEFVSDIEEKNGNVVPVILNQPVPSKQAYEVVDGRRRVLAVMEINERRKKERAKPLCVNAIIKKTLSEDQKETLQYQSNTYRENYSVLEYIENALNLRKKGRSVNQISKLLLRHESLVKSYLRISEQPELKKLLAQEKISLRDAIKVIRSENDISKDLLNNIMVEDEEKKQKAKSNGNHHHVTYESSPVRVIENETLTMFKVNWTKARKKDLTSILDSADRFVKRLKERAA